MPEGQPAQNGLVHLAHTSRFLKCLLVDMASGRKKEVLHSSSWSDAEDIPSSISCNLEGQLSILLRVDVEILLNTAVTVGGSEHKTQANKISSD